MAKTTEMSMLVEIIRHIKGSISWEIEALLGGADKERI